MSNESKGAEWKVGLFIAIGIGIIAVMSVIFGKLGTGFEKFYSIKVEFPDASGLLKGAEVRMAGAPVGFAAEKPQLVENRYAVTVPLRIKEGVKIPRNARITIDTAGLMGDAFVDISLPEKPDRELLVEGSMALGVRKEGLADLTAKSGAVMVELQQRLKELEDPIKAVKERVLSESNTANLQMSIANIREFTDSLKKTGKELGDIVDKAKAAGTDLSDAMTSAKGAMSKIDGVVAKVDAAAAEIKPALAGLRGTMDSVDKAVGSVRQLLQKANQGQGALGLLLSDRETAENIKSFVRNLKTRGIIWYKDRPEKER